MKDRFYHPELDRLRFLAFFVVFIHHYFPLDPLAYRKLGSLLSMILANCVAVGALGVDLFFCLSSFLITTLLLREFDFHGTIDIRAFWIRRILRIWPLYYFFVAFTALIVPFLLREDHFGRFYMFGYIFLAGNWTCVAEGYPPSVIAPLWSVSIEEQFYLLWPLLLSIVSCRRLPHLAISCLLIATIMRIFAVQMDLPHPGIWCNTFARLDPVALGALFALYNHRNRYSIRNAARPLLFALGVTLPPALQFLFGDSCYSGKASLFFYPAVSVSCVCILAAFYRNVDNPVRSTSKISATLVYLGRISYGLYVFHVFGIDLCHSLVLRSSIDGYFVGYKGLLFLGQFPFAFLVTVGFAAVSYSLLEKPFLRLKRRFTYVESAPLGLQKSGIP